MGFYQHRALFVFLEVGGHHALVSDSQLRKQRGLVARQREWKLHLRSNYTSVDHVHGQGMDTSFSQVLAQEGQRPRLQLLKVHFNPKRSAGEGEGTPPVRDPSNEESSPLEKRYHSRPRA